MTSVGTLSALTVSGNGSIGGTLGVGGATPSLYHSATNGLVVSRGGINEGITIDCSNQAGIFFSNGSNGAVDINGQLIYYHTANDESMRMLVDGGERMRINNDRIITTVEIVDPLGSIRSFGVVTKSSDYTPVHTDAGKMIKRTGGNVTIAYDGAFDNGDIITILNTSSTSMSIIQGAGNTLYNTADGTTGNRTLAARGSATVLSAAGTTFYISGSGLS